MLRRLFRRLSPRMRRVLPLSLLLLAAAVAAGLWRGAGPRALDSAQIEALYARPLAPPGAGLRVFHLGHSLVGRDMPAMLEQLAHAAGAEEHVHHSQLGWGTTLKAHWDPATPIPGFETENAHPRFRPAAETLDAGNHDVLVLTEMVEIRDAIRYFDSAAHMSLWVGRARAGNPAMRVYLYETWHRLDDPEGWLERVDRDLARYWEAAILYPALARDPAHPVYLIPGGQVLARFVRRIESMPGGVDGLSRREDLFAREDDGTVDPIHFNDLGAYLLALVHYAVLYHRDPRGLPRALLRADGTPADPPGPAAAALMQEVVREVVADLPRTGVAPGF